MGASFPSEITVPGGTLEAHFHTDGSGTYWGIKATCTAEVVTPPGGAPSPEQLKEPFRGGWNLSYDRQLVKLINQVRGW